MRPIKLTISAFGPYAGKEVLDMDSLGERGIYLITGDTGAGKSTIFDAIMFCLYGVTSAGKRTAAEMRSTYAEPRTETFVELVFDYRGKRYTVRRSPEYMREKLRGEGMAKSVASADLTDETGLHLTKITEVDAKLAEIIGLTADQFSGIAMIAQGEFQKVLTADTRERQQIFRKLFNTENYEALSFKLKHMTGDMQKDLDKLKTEMDTHIRSCAADEESDLNEKLAEAKAGTLPETEIEALFNAIRKHDKELLEEAKAEQDKAQKNYDDLNREAGEQKSLKEISGKLEGYRRDLDKLSEESENAESALKEEQSHDKERKALGEKITILENDLGKYDELDKKNAALQDLNKSLTEAGEALDEKKQDLKDAEEEIGSVKDDLKKYEGLDEKIIELTEGKAKAEADYRMASEYTETLREYGELKETSETASKEYAEAREKEKAQSKKAHEMYQAMLDDRAGFLAEEVLREGEKCPVCGSIEHPDIAKRSGKAPTDEEVEAARKELEDLQELMQDKSSAAKEAGAFLNSAADSVKKFEKAMPELAEAGQDAETEYKKVLDGVISSIEQAEKDKEVRAGLSKKLEELSSEHEKLVKEEGNMEKDFKALEARARAAQDSFDEAKEKLEYESLPAAEEAVKGFRDELENSEKALSDARERVQDIHEKIKTLEGQIKEGEEQTKDFDSEKYEALEAELEALAGEVKKAQDAKSGIDSRISSNDREFEAYRECSGKWEEKAKEYSLIKDLSDTASGELSGRSKLMLETFVQTAYLDRILRHANMKLRRMSEMRYELVRRKTGLGKKKQSGLDLNVIDHHNGTERGVNTLSGGESFMASLSLALGLSEEIREASGGIRLDTMFVDEGFGTLSEDALQSAVKALMELSEEDRLVGIISHVEELRQRIDKKIVIKQNKTGGSHASIEL